MLLRDVGVELEELYAISEHLRSCGIEVLALVNPFQPSMVAFDFEKGVFDEKAVILEAARFVSIRLPFVLIKRALRLKGGRHAFCDLELRGCVVDVTGKEKLLQDAVRILLKNGDD